MKQLLLILFLFGTGLSFAQKAVPFPCGVTDSLSTGTVDLNKSQPVYSGSADPEVLAAYPAISFNIYFWVITDGTPTGITEEVLLQNVNRVNEFYKPMGISFVYTGFGYINNSLIYEDAVWYKIQKYAAAENHITPNSFNVYIPKTLVKGNGITGFGSSQLAVNQAHTLGTFGATLGNTLAHELAHCFKLYHPWGPSNGQMHTDENNTRDPNNPDYNALTAGDMIHDTAAMGSFFTEAKKNHNDDITAIIDANCNYSGVMTDGLGAPLAVTPYDVGNIMSYTRGSCVHGFTTGQGIRIREYIAATPEALSVQAMRSESPVRDVGK